MSFPRKTFLSLTLAGWVMIGLIGCVCYWSLVLRDIVLWIVWMSLSLYFLCALGSCGWVFLVIKRTLCRPLGEATFLRKLECNSEHPSHLSIPVLSWTPLAEVVVAWKLPPHVDVWIAGHDEWVRPLRRGLSQSLFREIEVTDLFRLVSFRFTADSGCPVRILPASQRPTSELQFVAGQGGEVYSLAGKPEGDRFNLRVYSPGDPIKFVMWRRLTPDGQFYVRLPENVESPHVTILFWAGESDDASAELARFLIEKEPMGNDWSFRVSTSPEAIATSQEEALNLLAESGNQQPDDGGMTRGCLTLEDAARNNQGSFIVLLVPDQRDVGERGAALMNICNVTMCGELSADNYALRNTDVQRVRMTGGGVAS